MKRKAAQITPSDEDTGDAAIDSNESRALIEFCKSLPQKTPDVVRFYGKKGQKPYYVVHDEDTELIADEFYHTRKDIKPYNVGTRSTGGGSSKMQKNDTMRHLTINNNALPNVVRYLVVDRRFKVEIYTSEDRKWRLKMKGTPGNLQELEDLIFTEDDLGKSPVMLAVKIVTEKSHRVVGAAYCDTILRKIGVCEFIDDEKLTNLQGLVFQVGASEAFVAPLDEHDADSKKLHELLAGDKRNVIVSVRKKNEFDAKDIEQDLARLLGSRKFEATNLLDLKHAMSAAACLISGLELLTREENFGAFGIQRFDNKNHMRLDNAAVQALNLLPTVRDPNSQHCLYGIMNRCKTQIGARLLLQWMKQPLLDVDKINVRLNVVESMLADWNMTQVLAGTLRRVPDLERLARRLQRKKVRLEDVVNLYQFALKVPDIIAAFQDTVLEGETKELITSLFVTPLSLSVHQLEKFQQLVEAAVDADSISEGQYRVNPEFSPDLKVLYEHRKKLREKLDRHADTVKIKLDNPKNFSLEHDSKSGGWVFRVTKKDESLVKEKKFSIVSTTKGGGTKFTDSTLSELSGKYDKIVEEYTQKSEAVVLKIAGITVTYTSVFEELHRVISEVDVYHSLADLAHNAVQQYVRPTIKPMGQGGIILSECRHPVLEAQPDMQFVSNDIHLTRDKSQFVIITGPNMGGKSTYIRQTGVVVLMAQMGSFVPCSEAEITICDAILTRVGAGDSQLRGVSTFMAEMLETAAILRTANPQSLVIIDELGRGTSTYDGFGLAWAISEYICHRSGSFCLFATHFHELTQLQEEIPFVSNRHVSAVPDNDRGIVLQYKVEPGPSDQSFGIHVAKIAHFPPSVIAMAEKKAKELESFETASNRGNAGEQPSAAQAEQDNGEMVIDSYLREFTNKNIGSMAPQDLKIYLADLEKRLEAEPNPYVRQILASHNM